MEVAELAAGDALFIPIGWWHHVVSHADDDVPGGGPCVALNAFWNAPREDWDRRVHLKSFRSQYELLN